MARVGMGKECRPLGLRKIRSGLAALHAVNPVPYIPACTEIFGGWKKQYPRFASEQEKPPADAT
jgi:hypothetical protein